MTKTLTLIIASTALTAALGIPAWSAMHAAAPGEAISTLTTLLDASDEARPLVLVDEDEDDHDDDGASPTGRAAGDDGDDDEDECDDDEGSCGAGTSTTTPVTPGSVAPPQNGLFGTGAPQVQVK